MKSSGLGSPNRSHGFNAESESASSNLHTTDSRGPTHRASFASDALQRAPRPASAQTAAGNFSTRSRGGSPVHQTRAGQTGAPSASNAPSSARTAATSNVFELLRAGALQTHRIAQAELEGFSDSEASALEPMVHMILEALGPIFPPGHDDIRITRKTLSRDLARTVFYGKAADIELDLDAHLDKGKTVLDALTCARIAQTLTHEIMLHTRKEFQEYFSTKKISRTGGGREGHQEACLPETRDEYFHANYLVSRRFTPASRREFAQSWAEEIKGLAADPSTRLSLSKEERAELRQWTAEHLAILQA